MMASRWSSRYNLDNSAAKAFFFRSGVGRIRHISVRILWLQRDVKLGLVAPSTVSTRDNTADLGTKRLNRDRMRYLMNLCKVYDLSQSTYVGQETVDKVHQAEAMSEGIRLLRNNGLKTGAAKSIMRVLLLGALGLPCEAMPSASIGDGGHGSFAAFGIYVTVICLVAGVSFFLGTQFDVMKDECRRIMVNRNLRKVLKLLKRVKSAVTGIQEAEESELHEESEEEEIPEESPSEIEDDPLDNQDALHRAMVETNGVLTARERRLLSEWNEAEARNDVIAMEEIEGLLVEVRGLPYNV